MHAGRQDVAILRRAWHTERAQRLRHAGGRRLPRARQPGGLRVAGAQGARRRGSRAPRGSPAGTAARSPTQQLEYAADDARCLLALGEGLEQRLEERGRLEWAREECRALEEVTDERDAGSGLRAAARASAGSSESGRAVARELVEWREEIARGDGPPGGLRASRPGADGAGAARARPTANGLEQIRGLPPQTLHRRGDRLLAAIERGLAPRAAAAPPTPPARDAGGRAARVAGPGAGAPALAWTAAWRWS